MLYNAAFESELLLEGHILLWTLNELGGRLLNFQEDSSFSLLLLYVPINSRFTTGLPQPPPPPHLQGRPAGVYYRMHLRSGTDIPA